MSAASLPNLIAGRSPWAELRSEKTTVPDSRESQSTDATSPVVSPTPKLSLPLQTKYGSATDLSKPWRMSTGPLSCKLEWRSEMLTVYCSAISGLDVIGLVVLFRNTEVTNDLYPDERRAIELVLIENFYKGDRA